MLPYCWKIKIPGRKVYPNPTRDGITISLPENWSVQSIILRDMQGKEIKFFSPVDRNLNMKKVARGKYVLIIEGEKGVVNEKIIVW